MNGEQIPLAVTVQHVELPSTPPTLSRQMFKAAAGDAAHTFVQMYEFLHYVQHLPFQVVDEVVWAFTFLSPSFLKLVRSPTFQIPTFFAASPSAPYMATPLHHTELAYSYPSRSTVDTTCFRRSLWCPRRLSAPFSPSLSRCAHLGLILASGYVSVSNLAPATSSTSRC